MCYVTEFIKVETFEQAAAVEKLAGGIWRQHYTSIIGAQQVEYMLQKFQSAEAIFSQIQTQHHIYYMVMHKSVPCGYFSYALQGDRLFLSKAYLDCQCRGKGIFGQIIDHIKDYATANDAKQIYLTVSKANAQTIAVYKAKGFTTATEAVTDIGGGFYMDDYIMTLNLRLSGRTDNI